MRPTPTLAVLAALAAPPAFADDPPALDTLVEQLGDPDYRTREAAGKHLAAAGDRAIPALRAALAAKPDPETARRLTVLVARLDADRLTTARRVTLKNKSLSAKAALAEVARQSGYPVRADGLDDDARYAFDLDNVPFWQALDRVCDAAGLTANLQDDTGAVTVFANDSANPFVAYAGPFRVVAASVTANQNIHLSGLPRAAPFARQPDYVSVNFQVMSEPKAPLIGVGQVEPVRAVDDTGGSLVPAADPAQPRTSYYPAQPAYRSYNLSATLNLARSSRAATEIRELRAKVPVLVLSDTRPDVVVPDLLAAKGRRVGGRELDVEISNVVAEPGGLVTVTLLVTRRVGSPDDYVWLNGLSQRVEVHDAAGRKVPLGSVDQTTSGPNATTLTLQFGPAAGGKKASKPARLVVVEWVTITKDVEFTMKHVPLP
jgi:hypothetical protein